MSIDKLLLKVLNKSNSLEELETLESWLKDSEQNIALIEALKAQHHNMEYKTYDKSKAWKKISSQINESIGSSTFKWIAVILILAIIVSAFIFLNKEDSTLPTYNAENQTEHFVLQDKSEIWLNNNSQIAQVEDFNISRHVNLSGEAFFSITPDQENPFIVSLSDQEFIKVVGTSFNVINLENEFDLIIYSGKVEYHSTDRTILLEKGERLTKVDEALVKLKNSKPNAISWKTKELVFDNAPLNKVFEDLENHYSTKILLNSDINIADCTLYSRYNDLSLDTVLLELSKIFNLQYQLTSDGVIVENVSCQ